jgi:anti-anti-sigma regulatory factor
LSDDRNTIAQLLRRTILFQSQHRDIQSELDLTGVNYLGPFAAAILLANELYSRHAGHPPRIRFPVKPKVKAFLHFSGLDSHFGNGPEPDTAHPENVTVPLRIVQKATWNAADPVIELVHRHAVLSEDDENLWGHITNPLGGEIFIITEDVMGFSDREGRLRTMPLGVRFAGTGVFFTVPVDR